MYSSSEACLFNRREPAQWLTCLVTGAAYASGLAGRFLLRKKANAATPTMASEPKMVPTAISALVPVVRPSEPELELELAAVAVAVGLTAVVSPPLLKLLAVTLKQGTVSLKSAASTKV
jgi:hypothetical protein